MSVYAARLMCVCRCVCVCVCVCTRRWAHVMCAVALPEVRFSDEARRSPIDTSRIPMQRYKLVRTHTHTHTVFHK